MNARVHCGPDFITDGQQRDHDLSGNYKGTRECHIEPDWLLVYKKDNNNLILFLIETGSHSDLF